MIRILTKNGVDNTNVDGARDHNFNAGRRSGIVKGALNQGNFFASSSNTIVLDSCELRLCGHRVVIDSAEYLTFHNKPSVTIRYSLIAQIIVDNDGDVSFDLHAQTSSTALVQDNLDASGSGTYELEIGRFTQLTDGTITDVVRTADLITGGAGGGDSEYIRIGTVTTNKISPELDADVDIENTINPADNKPQTNFTFNLPTPSGTVVSLNGVEKTSINTDITPTANSENLITSGGVHDYPAITFAESERQKSKNLIPFPYYDGNSKATNGITFTVNNDQSISVSGTIIDHNLNAVMWLAMNMPLKAGTYRISTSNSDNDIGVVAQIGDSYYSGEFTLSSDATARIYLQVVMGSTKTHNDTIRFMLCEGTDTDWQPYNGAIVHKSEIEPILIYDINTKNTIGGKTYTNGIGNGASVDYTINNIDLTPYKYMYVYQRMFGEVQKIFVDLTYSVEAGGYCGGQTIMSYNIDALDCLLVKVPTSKNSITFNARYIKLSDVSLIGTPVNVCRIEGFK